LSPFHLSGTHTFVTVNALKSIASIILLFAFATQTFNQGMIVLNYYMNTAAFAKNCENKVRPAMHCNGKCQMAKELKKEEQKNSQNSERKLTNKTEVISSKSFFAKVSVEDQQPLQTLSSLYKSGISTDSTSEIFHPPTVQVSL